ncbi:single-stranded-DNA-specific exonuclease RecJ [Paenibacillus sp. GCM10027627]|uniref:single-stranded-DNA-specific exonuclease RecJ n=1 Tax=unclassified Paenibacillus TaxID=185978 RepID=UPI003643D3BC
MIDRKTRWTLANWEETDEEAAGLLSEKLALPPLVARLLVQRGYRNEERARIFLYGDAGQLHDPYLMRGMEQAVERIRQAGQSGEKIRIYGDYDADGVSSTSLLIHVFRHLHLQFDYYIPHRSLEGYGLNRAAIAAAAEQGVTLIVTVDTGISAYEEVEFAKSVGIDIVVTDHHEPPEQLPDACAIVNPKQRDCLYPFKGLAGVGVAFKLATALMERPPLEWADIVSLGTIADLMPLVDENRIFVQYGLKKMKNEPSTGFRALAEAAGLELDSMTSTGVAFGMAPRINAAGRLDHAKRAVEVLTAVDYDEAILGAVGLDTLNKERQRIVESIVKEAEALWQAKKAAAEGNGVQPPSVIVLAGEGWNVGVIGIVASKLLERHYKPVIILGIDAETGKCKGSARSIDGFDLYASLSLCADLFDHFGGHQAAAGMSLHRDHLEQLEEKMSSLAQAWLSEEDWIPKTLVDIDCTLEDATLSTISQLALLEPFGIANPSPRLLFQKLELAERRAIGKESKHLKLMFGRGRKLLDAIGFGRGELASLLSEGSLIDVIGELSINEWNGQRKPQLQVHDLHQEEPVLESFPSREQFGQVYQMVRREGRLPLRGLAPKLAETCGLTVEAVKLMLDVFEELRFIRFQDGYLIASASPEKRELASSERYRAAMERNNQSTAPA